MRSVPEWVGETDDVMPPVRVRARVFALYSGICQCGCGIRITPGDIWDADHQVALINGGENRESNLVPMLREHHKVKTG
jgi:5-methylcytosine-specific restriction enzyme A